MLVELKNGETFNGHLVNCDNFMNITLREVYQTSADGDRFWKLKECYIRGSTTICLQIKYLRVPDTLLDTVKEEQARAREANRSARGTAPGARGASLSFSCVARGVFGASSDCCHLACSLRHLRRLLLLCALLCSSRIAHRRTWSASKRYVVSNHLSRFCRL
ncbi:hypothetical protein ID866_6864 [Astraeus odoratus]|nr:hypothetical protein ID866_6864 [Astraeus odoratus]